MEKRGRIQLLLPPINKGEGNVRPPELHLLVMQLKIQEETGTLGKVGCDCERVLLILHLHLLINGQPRSSSRPFSPPSVRPIVDCDGHRSCWCDFSLSFFLPVLKRAVIPPPLDNMQLLLVVTHPTLSSAGSHYFDIG